MQALDVTPAHDPALIHARALPRLRAEGAVLLRGEFEYPDFLAISDAFGCQPMPHVGGAMGRQSVDEEAMVSTAPSGTQTQAMELHGENYYQANRPDLLFFHCRRPSAEAGETLLADGARVYEALRTRLGEERLGRRMTYHRRRPPSMWTQAYGTESKEELLRFCRDNDVQAEFEAGDVLYTRYTDAICHRSRWGGQPVFINNLVTWGMQVLSRPQATTVWVTYEDGSPIESEFILEARQACQELSTAHVWRTGDIVIIDNTRTLHGRNAFTDPTRHILLRMGRLAGVPQGCGEGLGRLGVAA